MQTRLLGRALGVSVFAALLGTSAHAQCPTPDGFEPNNDCASAPVITPGTYTGLTCHGVGSGADDPDFFRVDVPAGEQINVQVHHTVAPDQDLNLFLFDAAQPSCGALFGGVAASNLDENNEFASWVNTTGSTVTIVAMVVAYGGTQVPVTCDEYDLVVDVGPDVCGTALDDAYEDNDDCASATSLAAGIYTGLVVRDTDLDYYRVTVPAGDRLTVDLFYGIDGFGQDLQIDLFSDTSCSTLVESASWEGSNTVRWTNDTGAPVDASFTVFPVNFPACNEYSLQVATAPDACLQAPDDAFEPNDACQSPVAVSTGSHTGLFVSKFDPDYYSIVVQPLDRVVFDATYLAGDGEIQLSLATDSNCVLVVDAMGNTGNDTVAWGNNTGAARTVYLEVSVPIFAEDGCNTYDLAVSVAPDPCLAVPDDLYEPNDDCASSALLTAGTYTSLFFVENDPDHYQVDVPDGHRLTARAVYDPLDGALRATLYSDPFCGNPVDEASFAGVDEVAYTNLSGSTQTYTVRVDEPPFATTTCLSYDLQFEVVPDPCINGADDSFEPNDDCASGAAMPTGLHQNLFVSGSDRDYYRLDVPAGDRMTIDASYDPSSHPLLITLYDDTTCTTLIDQQGWSGIESFTYTNSGAATATLTLAVETDSGAPDSCNDYSLDIASAPDPCLQVPDDHLEENDTCFGAAAITHATYPGLFTSYSDADYYELQLDAGETLEVHAVHVAANGDLDMKLFDAPFACSNPFGSIAVAATSNDDEVLFFTNETGQQATFYLEVKPWQTDACNQYDLTALFSGTPLASPICFGDGTWNSGAGVVGCPCGNLSALGAGEGCQNSQGHGAVLTASGTALFALDDLVLTVSQARPNQPSMLVQGATLTAVPFKDGLLCAGNPTERVEVVILDGRGAGSTSGSIATQGNVPGPGHTRYYQQWYRDPMLSPCGAGSNFSAGLRVSWL